MAGSPYVQVSVIAKHELSLNQWVELFQFVMLTCNSTDAAQREASHHQVWSCDCHVTLSCDLVGRHDCP